MKKKYVFILALIPVFLFVLWKISRSRTFQFFGEIYPRIETGQKVVALTFDDGPTRKTARILAILHRLNIKATFFVTGQSLAENEAEGKQIVLEGHQLGNHTYMHNRMVFKSFAFVKSEVEKTDSLIRRTGFREEILFRPPNGKKLILLPYYLNQTNRKTIMWDVEPESYAEIAGNSEKITKHVLANTKPGSIILLHVMYDDGEESIKAITEIVAGLKQRNYAFKTVNELLQYRQSVTGNSTHPNVR
ncbi:polysaccharide deacetylase family protein [Larkinella rosea]|uniref:Polysaccharide deacetylase n=1 Tax=Larkinella rosea TaxID=2025312 RepID=A0A3P1BT48_9BACT|nr:polysaccharide deacetylase family protein [Larkinella rosea]RRB04295.1 polysaccharide deacetylase [Larkinella rosea]